MVFFDNELDELWAAIVTPKSAEQMSEAGKRWSKGFGMGSRIAWFDFRVGRFYVYDQPTDEASEWIEVLNDYFGEACFHFAFVPGSDFTAEVTPVLFDEDWRKDGRKRTVSSAWL